MASLTTCPAEILGIILSLVGTADSKSLRSVCRLLENHITPQLFSSVFLTLFEKDLNAAGQICEHQHLYRHIKTVFVSPLSYDFMTLAQYKDRVRERIGLTGTALYRRFRPWHFHATMGYNFYKNTRTATDKTLKSTKLSCTLTKVLTRGAGIQRMILVNSREPRLSEADLGQVCPNRVTCPRTPAVHDVFYLPPTEIWDRSSQRSIFIDAIISALEVSSRNSQEFAMMPAAGEMSIRYQVFNIRGHQLQNTRTVFSRLTKLKLNLGSSIGSNMDEDAWNNMSVARVLSAAVNIKALIIEADTSLNAMFVNASTTNYRRSTFQALFHGCNFPELKRFYIGTITAEEGEILTFIRAAKELRHLVIQRCFLRVGEWKAVTKHLRDEGNLRVANLSELYRGNGITSGTHNDISIDKENNQTSGVKDVHTYHREWF